MKKQKLIVILGPTASGKSDLAVRLAQKIGGEVVSADSRQVYKGLDIGTGKITKKEMAGIPHHLLDVASPKKVFTVDEYKKQALKAIDQIHKKGKIPILAGGTGFYIQAVVDDIPYPNVPPNPILREKLQKKPAETLFKILKKLDPKRAKTIDSKNPPRLIRAIEIATVLGAVPGIDARPGKTYKGKYDVLQIGISTTDSILKEKIQKRLASRLKNGMIAEGVRLHRHGVSWKRMHQLGLEYRYLSEYLQKHISKDAMESKLNSEIRKYARRQKTWFRRDSRIKWFALQQKKAIEQATKRFLK